MGEPLDRGIGQGGHDDAGGMHLTQAQQVGHLGDVVHGELAPAERAVLRGPQDVGADQHVEGGEGISVEGLERGEVSGAGGSDPGAPAGARPGWSARGPDA